jgi:DNA (cytosine-5)-methyltransferase 1
LLADSHALRQRDDLGCRGGSASAVSVSCEIKVSQEIGPKLSAGAGIDVYDFFSGCGGTTAGLSAAGLSPKIAVDFDADALETYSMNFPNSVPILHDITKLHTWELESHFEKSRDRPVLFCACAPCQPFSKQNRQKQPHDARASLLRHLRRFVERFRPELLFVENVPGLGREPEDGPSPLDELKELLADLSYSHDTGILHAQDYGVPQSRRRLLVVASQFGPIKLPKPTHGMYNQPHLTVADAIGDLPPIAAGESHGEMLNHRAAGLSALNMRRIQMARAGGSWRDWNDDLRLACHEGITGYTDVYGRMSWSRPAPPLTTRCISLSNGRFGHPEQDRAISVREAACLQTFDRDFQFAGNLASMAKQIGNAVPVRLAQAVGEMFNEHVARHYWSDNGKS